MRVLHTYCLNYNLGDYALGIGVKNLLRYNFDIDYIGETNLQGRVFNEYYINEVVNKKYDLLVIGGGGIIHGKHWPNGWFWLIDKDLIKTIKIPFIIYGAGYNYWIEEGGMPQRGIKHLEETIKYAKFFSVRNDGSAKRVKDQLGIDCEVVPDPGFHINLNTTYENVNETSPYVLVQVANDKSDMRFGCSNEKNIFIKNMKDVTYQLSKKYKVIFAPHVFDDVLLSRDISEGIPNTEVWNFGKFAFDNVKEAISYYKTADFVISMRGHGQIIPIAFNTPVISLENHPKHKGLMEELNLLEYNVSIDKDLANSLSVKIEMLENNMELLKRKYESINSKLNIDSNNSWNKIKTILNG